MFSKTEAFSRHFAKKSSEEVSESPKILLTFTLENSQRFSLKSCSKSGKSAELRAFFGESFLEISSKSIDSLTFFGATLKNSIFSCSNREIAKITNKFSKNYRFSRVNSRNSLCFSRFSLVFLGISLVSPRNSP